MCLSSAVGFPGGPTLPFFPVRTRSRQRLIYPTKRDKKGIIFSSGGGGEKKEEITKAKVFGKHCAVDRVYEIKSLGKSRKKHGDKRGHKTGKLTAVFFIKKNPGEKSGKKSRCLPCTTRAQSVRTISSPPLGKTLGWTFGTAMGHQCRSGETFESSFFFWAITVKFRKLAHAIISLSEFVRTYDSFIFDEPKVI